MKYLDENITALVEGFHVTENGTYIFKVIDMDNHVIFTGNVFLTAGTRSVRIDLNDFIEAQKDKGEFLRLPFYSHDEEVLNLFNKYKITLTINGTDYTSNTTDVALMYRYPNQNTALLTDFFDIDSTGIALFRNCLQGGLNGSLTLVPRIPFKYTFEYGFGVTLEANMDMTVQLSGADGIEFQTMDVDYYPPCTINFWTLNKLFRGSSIRGNGRDGALYINGKRVCTVDVNCMSKYYVMWQDRYGGIQSQPFDKIDTFTENISASKITNFRNEKNVSNVDVTPKWDVQTGWINEKYYPFYESILVSPYVVLYDTENDKSYNVIPTDNTFTEKTYRNQQNKLFNIKFSFELNKHQIIKY